MTSCAELLDQIEPEGHLVQLYGNDDRLLISNVTRFLGQGLSRGDGVLVVATPDHSGSIARQLRTESVYSKAVLEGRLVFLDAQATLDRLSVDGLPDLALFHNVIGEALKGVQSRAGHTGVRAYGEMVGLLWKAGQRAAAVLLEEYWNRLLQSSNISLFCAYPLDIFAEDFQVDTVDALLCSHTHLVPVDAALEGALERALNEVLGSRAQGLRALMKANHRPSWGEVPRPEAMILWLRNNLPGSAREIIRRAHQYYQPLPAGRT
jgi:hypothetical protein